MDENRKWSEDGLPTEDAQAEAETRTEATDVGAMMETLRADLEEKVRRALEEALRVSGMDPEERAAYDAKSRERALEAREQALARREARADALELLAEKGLPAALADAVRCDTREDARVSVEALDAAFREAVQEAVEARLKGVAPIAGASAQDEGANLDDQSYYRMVMGGRA